MFADILKKRITKLRDTMRDKRRQHDRERDHLKALVIESGTTVLTLLLDKYLIEPSLNSIISKRVDLLSRSRDHHLTQCALPDDCHIALDYNARIEELEWLQERLSGSTAEIPMPDTCDQSNCPKHL